MRFFQNVASTDGGAITSYNVNLHIDSSIFEYNAASYNSLPFSDSGSGGVLYISSSSLFMSNCTAKHSYATNGGVIQGIKSEMSITNCLFKNNTADLNAGAIQGYKCDINLTDCLFEYNNAALVRGGAMSITNISLRADNVTYQNNTGRDDGGEAIYASQCKIYLSNSLFSENRYGGAIGIFGNSLRISNTTFSNNLAQGTSVLDVYDVAEIQLINCVFINNAYCGAAVSVIRSTFLSINSTFDGNLVESSLFCYATDSSCVVLLHSEASFENCTFNGNMNSSRGGAIVSRMGELRISTSVFDNNGALQGKDIFL